MPLCAVLLTADRRRHCCCYYYYKQHQERTYCSAVGHSVTVPLGCRPPLTAVCSSNERLSLGSPVAYTPSFTDFKGCWVACTVYDWHNRSTAMTVAAAQQYRQHSYSGCCLLNSHIGKLHPSCPLSSPCVASSVGDASLAAWARSCGRCCIQASVPTLCISAAITLPYRIASQSKL